MANPLLEECKATHKQIVELESGQLESRRAAAHSQTLAVQQQIQACNAELAAAQAELARAQAALAKLGSGLRPSNWFRSDASTAAKQSREEAAIAQANAGIARAQARLAELHASLHQAQQEEAALGSQTGMLQGLRAKRAAQLQALAGAPEFAGEPRLGVLAAEAQAARGEAAQNSAWAAQYATADAGLRRAQASLQSAVGSLRASKAINTVGVVGSIQRRRQPGPTRRGPVLPGAIQMSQVRRADAQIAAAVQQILAVHAALPTLPYIEPAKLRGASRGVFVNLLVGGLGTQLYSQAQLSSGVAQAERMLGQLKQCLEWTTANAAAFRQREANANAAAAAKTAEREALQIQALTRL